ncbi:DNA mismatch repair endonuclease MutL [Macrococcus sp. DPC7161]|uniref:DNA mismatch repair endonuclease MutL n=1 Tax=Macrococcus sp. DPC7161 TaxID=2507060 RepID=UPI00100B9BB2|nr:DNA mismatch repair endonuclease MutL [Macrococcus sp. DPC7161]RXK19037.1 DNA mismatch repair endonuclease MutL [Macrococcus sp. DPC7161]
MGKIKTLSAALSNKIAAGEVIERPQSVVKELVENAIDAGSTSITIEVKEAGLQQIKVIDNGSGIEEDDLALMFERHATSKINDTRDLFHIRTLGFRGEALASIASVSKVTAITCTDKISGHMIRVENSKIIEQKPAKARKGTEIIVDSLFYNTPARLKYVKSLQTELGKITDIINRYILSFPEIKFTLISDDKEIVASHGNNNHLAAMKQVYGMNIVKDAVEIHGETGDYTVDGIVIKPVHSRANRHYISIFINGRYIKNFMLNKAIMAGYHTLMNVGRYPIVNLRIQMDPNLVDVNVHPTKQEVRLSKEPELMQLIEKLIHDALWQENLIPVVETKPKEKLKVEQPQFDYFEQMTTQSAQSILKEESNNDKEQSILNNNQTYSFNNQNDKVIESNVQYDVQQKLNDEFTSPPVIEIEERIVEDKQQLNDEHEQVDVKNDEYSPIVENEHPKRHLPFLEVVGQVHGTYIICQNDTGMFMIDQHAAQERIKYEFFKHRIGEVTHELQSLLFPITLQFTSDEAFVLPTITNHLQSIGIELEHFGGNDYIVNEVPVWFPEDAKSTLEDLIEYIKTHRKVDLNQFREETAIMMSCKKSIKANHYLTKEDMTRLIKELSETNEPYTCPHGRPITIQFTNYELEKLFKRVM